MAARRSSALVVLGLAVAGCGSGGGESTTRTASTERPAAKTASPAAAYAVAQGRIADPVGTLWDQLSEASLNVSGTIVRYRLTSYRDAELGAIRSLRRLTPLAGAAALQRTEIAARRAVAGEATLLLARRESRIDRVVRRLEPRVAAEDRVLAALRSRGLAP